MIRVCTLGPDKEPTTIHEATSITEALDFIMSNQNNYSGQRLFMLDEEYSEMEITREYYDRVS